MKSKHLFLKTMAAGLVACSSILAGSNIMISAKEVEKQPVTEEKVFKTKEEAEQWIQSFDSKRYDIKSSIAEVAGSGVTAKPTDEGGYHLEYDEANRNMIIHITGGVKDIAVKIDYKDDPGSFAEGELPSEELMPGSKLKWTYTFINESGDNYVNAGSTYETTDIYERNDANTPVNAVNRVSNLDHMTPTYKWILKKYGLTSFDRFDEKNPFNYNIVKLTEDQIPEGTIVQEVQKKPKANEETFANGPYYFDTTNHVYYEIKKEANPRWKGNVNAENVLAYYNAHMNSAYTDLNQAYRAFFFNKLWTVTHTPSMDMINLPDETPISMDVVGTLDGWLTDNMYEDLRFGFMDTIHFTCPDVTQYKATVELTEKVKPQPKPEEQKPEEEKPKPEEQKPGEEKPKPEESKKEEPKKEEGTKTASYTGGALMSMAASASLLGMIGLVIMKKNRKE